MSLLWKVVVASACKGTHHKLAMDALRHLRNPNADLWQNLFLKHHEAYLAGSKAPDDKFKDFKNHVLHVGDNCWGGAVTACKLWYERTLLAMRRQYWSDVVYSAGVLSHYFTDPHMPFHTGQTEEEGRVHRAAEWSISCSYDELQSILENDLGGYPNVETPAGADWLAAMVKRGAQLAHGQYYVLLEHYDLNKGAKNPLAGLDQESKDIVAALLGHASVGFARVLDRLMIEAAVKPPMVELSVETFLASVKIPARWIMAKMADEKERAIVQKIYDEVRKTGKAIESLPEDDRQVRRLYAEQVLKVPVAQLDAAPARPTGLKHGLGAQPREQRDPRPLSGPVPLRGKSKPPKVINPLFKPVTAMKPSTTLTAGRFTPRTTLPISAARSSSAGVSSAAASGAAGPSKPPDDSRRSSRRRDEQQELPTPELVDETAESTDEAGAAAPSESIGTDSPPAARRRWFKRPSLDFLRKSRVGTGVGRMIEKAKSLPKKMRLPALPSGWKKAPGAASPPADEAADDATQPTRRVAMNVMDEPADEPTKSPAKSSNPLGTDAPRRRTDLEAAAARRDEKPAKAPPAAAGRSRDRQDDDDRDLRFYLEEENPLEAAPSIGPKMARRFEAIGLHTVADFLSTSADKIAQQLGIRAIDAKMIRSWQAQTTLACRIPQLRGHDAQILVGCGVTEPEELERMDERDLYELVSPFVATPEGQRILRNGAPPDLEEVKDWIRWAGQARRLRAA